jgi:hypothetical protein
VRTKSFYNAIVLFLRPLSDGDVKLHALLSKTPEYDAPFQRAGFSGSTVL